MKDITDRNFEIAAARHLGEPLNSLALKHGLHINSVSRIAQENAVLVTRRNNRRIPQGLTVRAAVALEDALGLWPTEKNRRQIAARYEGILRIQCVEQCYQRLKIGYVLHQLSLQPDNLIVNSIVSSPACRRLK